MGPSGWILQALDDLAQEDLEAKMAHVNEAVMKVSGGNNHGSMNGDPEIQQLIIRITTTVV